MIAAAMNATVLASGGTASLLQAFNEGSLGVSFGIAGEHHLLHQQQYEDCIAAVGDITDVTDRFVLSGPSAVPGQQVSS